VVAKAGLTVYVQIKECHFIRVLNIAIHLKHEDFRKFSSIIS